MAPFITPSLRYSIIPALKLRGCVGALRNCPIIDDHAVTHEDVALRVGSDVLLVRHHDDCNSAFVELLENCHDLDARAAIEIAGRLIRQQDLGIVDQRACYCHALLLPTRELAGGMIFAPGKSH